MSKKMEKGTENAIFLDGREYTAADLYRLIGLLVGNGVYANELAPTAANENMSITHGAGHAWISGVAYWNTAPFALGIATADGSLNRYDSLMLRLNISINEVYAVIVQGAYATNPTPPTCTRNAETFDLKLCDIYVPAGCTKITQDQITDTRLDSSVCGVPVFPVEHMDMTSFYRQIATDLANFQQGNEAEFSAWVEDQKGSNLATIAALVEVVRNTSDGSVAEIEALLQQLNELVNSDTVGELTNAINDKLPKTGGTMTGPIAMGGNRITDIGEPTDSTDAATKGYADAAAGRSALSLEEIEASDDLSGKIPNAAAAEKISKMAKIHHKIVTKEYSPSGNTTTVVSFSIDELAIPDDCSVLWAMCTSTGWSGIVPQGYSIEKDFVSVTVYNIGPSRSDISLTVHILYADASAVIYD